MTKHANLALFLDFEVGFPLFFKRKIDSLSCLSQFLPKFVTVLFDIFGHLQLNVAQGCQVFSTILNDLIVEFLASCYVLPWLTNMKFDFVDDVSC